ncbi:MAG: cytochrome P450 [Pseudomonadota bacterium]
MNMRANLTIENAPFLDVASPEFSIRSPEVRAARAENWFARTPYGIAVLRYAEMGQMLVHKSLRQGSHAWPELNGVHGGLFAEWWSNTILVTEGLDHRRLRRLVNPVFSPKTVRHMMSEFEAVTNAYIDGFIDQGQCDFMRDFADPYAGRVLTMLLGLPASSAQQILELASEMGLALGVTYKESYDRIEAATEELAAMIDTVLDQRMKDPGDDVLSQFVLASADGETLSRAELQNLGVMLVFAGVDTTRNQLGLGMTMFLDHQDQWEILAENPNLDMAASNECMRLRPTITWVSREAIEDFEFQGVLIPKGTILHLYSESAGTDPEVFQNSRFDITAKRDRNFGFGGGIHLCLGQVVAKNDMAVAYRILSQRLCNLRLAGTPTYLPDSGNTGPISLPIAFDKRG